MAITSEQGAEHFDAAEFDGLLSDHGTPVTWRRARSCPCLDPVTGQANPACAFCRDVPGILWDAGSDLIVLLPGRQRTDIFDQSGHRIEGVVTVTFPSGVTPGPYDRLDLPAAEIVVNNERHIRGELDGVQRSLERFRLVPIAVEYLEAILGADPLADPPVDGEVVQYAAGVDFTVGADGTIIWATDAGPPAGTLYTARYVARPAFVLWSPMSRDEGGGKQPYRSIAQRLEFFRQPAAGE